MQLKKAGFIFSFIGLMLLSSSAFGLQSGDFTYDVVTGGASGDFVTITGYTGTGGAVVIPSSINILPVWIIGSAAFHDKINITDISFPSGLKQISDSAFLSCTGLTNLTIPDNVTSIGANAFQSCSGLSSLTINNGIQAIGDNVFMHCSNLVNVNIPSSVIIIGASVFYGCSSLTSINVNVSNLYYSSQDGVLYNKVKTALIQYPPNKAGSFTIPSSVQSIGDFAFAGCASLTGVTISTSVATIGNEAFSYCTGLIGLTIPGNVTSIGGGAFEGCSGLTSVTITNGVSIIGDGAFIYTSLSNVTIPASVTSIGVSVFYGCSLLTDINVDSSNLVYSSQNGVLYNKTATTLIEFPQKKSGLFTIPSGVMIIGEGAFTASSLTSVYIPTSVTAIGNSAFNSSSYMASAYFYGNAPSMGTGVFDSCASGFTVYYTSGAIGFGNPWYTYPTALFTPPSTTTTSTPVTTTTSAPTTTTTAATTTTTTPGIPCPAKQVLGADNPQLENFRYFRDSKLANSAIGRKVIGIYYNNAESIDDALDRSPALKAFTRNVLEVIAPMVGNKEE